MDQVERTTKDLKKKKELRFLHIDRNKFTNKMKRCSYICKKDRTVHKQFHEYIILPEIDNLFAK